MLKAIIVDDEKQVRITLKKDIETFLDEVVLIGEADSVQSAVKWIDTLKPDLVFLDIDLGDGSGFSVLERVEYTDFRIIFISAHDNYAVKAFRVKAVDYLLKPYSKDELMEAVNKVETFYKNAKLEKRIDQAFLTSNFEERIAIPTSEGVELYAIDEIVYCQSNGNYCEIHFTNRKKLLSGKTLKEYEFIFKEYGFIRVHHSYLVNFKLVKKYLNKDGGFLRMIDDSEIPISQRKKSYVLSLLEKFLG